MLRRHLRRRTDLLVRQERAHVASAEARAMSESLRAEGSVLLDHYRWSFRSAREEFIRVLTARDLDLPLPSSANNILLAETATHK